MPPCPQWYGLSFQIIRHSFRFTPPLACAHVGLYGCDALRSVAARYLPEYKSLAGQLNQLPPLSTTALCDPCEWRLVANAALAEITRKLVEDAFVVDRQRIDELEEQFATQFASEVDCQSSRCVNCLGQNGC